MEETDQIVDILERFDLENTGEKEGYILDTRQLKSSEHYKLASDRTTVLIPQPTDNPNDPLNWSYAKKRSVLLIISVTALLPDYGSGTGAATLIPQAT